MRNEDSNKLKQKYSNSPLKKVTKINNFSKPQQTSKQGISFSNSNTNILNSFRKAIKCKKKNKTNKNSPERISINVEKLRGDSNNSINNQNKKNEQPLNQSFQIKNIFTSSKIKEILKDSKFDSVFKNKIQKIKSKHNYSSAKVNQLTYSNLILHKNNNSVKNKLDISIKKINYNLLKNKKISFITLYDDNAPSNEHNTNGSKSQSKHVSPRQTEKTIICLSKDNEKKDNRNDMSNLTKNLSSQIIIYNNLNFCRDFVSTKKTKGNVNKNKSNINYNKGHSPNTSTNNDLLQSCNNFKSNFLQSKSNKHLLTNKSKVKNVNNNSNNNSSILCKNSHSKSSSVFVSPESNHHSVNTSLSHLQLNMKINKKENHTANPTTQNSKKNSKEKEKIKKKYYFYCSNKLIKSDDEKHVNATNNKRSNINNNNSNVNINIAQPKITVNKNSGFIHNKTLKQKLKKVNKNITPNMNYNHQIHNINKNLSDISSMKSLFTNNCNLLKFKHNYIYSKNSLNNSNINQHLKNNCNYNNSTKNTSLSNKSVKRKEEIEHNYNSNKDYLKHKIDINNFHKNSLTTVQSKHNSKSTSRVEEQQSLITMNSKERVITLCKDKLFAKTAAHSPKDSIKCKIVYVHKTNKQNLNKPGKYYFNTNTNYKKKTIQKLSKKTEKENKNTNNKDINKHSFENRVNTDNILIANNILNEDEIKQLVTENLTIEKILNEENTYQVINTLNSIHSVNKDLYFYRKERDKVANYIQQYYETEGHYPSSKIHFYKYGQVIGRGAFGKVNIALHICSGQLVAIKSFNKKNLKNQKARKKIDQEIGIMKKAQSQFVTQILDYFENDTHIFIVMEYICEDLLNYISKRSQIPEITAKVIFKQIIEGIQFLHSKHIVHRDIKLDNILIDLSNTVKLCDFGVSRIVKLNDIMYDHCGTPAYIAPEIFLNNGYKGFACDVWSAGVTLHYMLSGNQPFKGSNLSKLHKSILEEQLTTIEGISNDANHLIQRMLVRNPKNRITIEEILYHPWLSGINTNIRENISLFTKAERILLSKIQVDYLNNPKEELIENFTVSNLNTVNDQQQKDKHNTKSLILTPYNTEKTNHENSMESSLQIKNSFCLFKPIAKQQDLKYQLNNNAEFDNGIINSQNESYQRNLNVCQNIIYNKCNNSSDINSYSPIPISPPIEPITSSSHDRGNNYYLLPEVDVKLCDEINKTIGYKVNYLIECIRNRKVNYATATYYLLLKNKKMKNHNVY